MTSRREFRFGLGVPRRSRLPVWYMGLWWFSWQALCVILPWLAVPSRPGAFVLVFRASLPPGVVFGLFGLVPVGAPGAGLGLVCLAGPGCLVFAGVLPCCPAPPSCWCRLALLSHLLLNSCCVLEQALTSAREWCVSVQAVRVPDGSRS